MPVGIRRNRLGVLRRGSRESRGSRSCLLVGLPGAGKTAFARAFAAYLGGTASVRPAQAEEGPAQRFDLPLVDRREGGRGTPLALIDAPALPEGISPDPGARRGAALTLRLLLESPVVLHVIDAARVGNAGALSPTDRAVAALGGVRWGGLRRAVLATKMDLPPARLGLSLLEREMAPVRVIPVSAVARRGFREVRAFLEGRLS